MNETRADISVAIETSGRAGGVALGRGDELAATLDFDASARHATQLIVRLDALLVSAGLRPADLNEVYVSAGPGSFTGLRIGITVARTLAQAVDGLRCVAVPTARVVAENVRDLDWQHLAVVLDARDGCACATLFARREGDIVPDGKPAVAPPEQLLAAWPRPVLLVGEALAYQDFAAEGAEILPPDSPRHVPTAETVWRIGRRMARAGQFTDPLHLLPVYSRIPEAVRLWEQRNGRDS